MDLKNKRVLITGADGFIGSHLTEQLVKEGAKVKAFVYYNAFNSWGWLDTLPRSIVGEIEVFAGDVRDASCVESATKDSDVVFHLAALIGIPFSYDSRFVFGNKCQGHSKCAAGRKKTGNRKAACDVDVGGLRHSSVRAH